MNVADAGSTWGLRRIEVPGDALYYCANSQCSPILPLRSLRKMRRLHLFEEFLIQPLLWPGGVAVTTVRFNRREAGAFIVIRLFATTPAGSTKPNRLAVNAPAFHAPMAHDVLCQNTSVKKIVSVPGAVATGKDFQMQELLSKMVGQEVDVVCTGRSSLRGKVVKVGDGVVKIKDDDDNVCYVALDKIIAVWEKRDRNRHPGFVFKT